MKIAVFGASVLLAVFFALLFSRRTTPPQNMPLRTPATNEAELLEQDRTRAIPSINSRTIEVAPETPATSDVQRRPILVRSSIGLPLSFVEWQASALDWLRVDLRQGRCGTESMSLPCLVRAPGHAAALLAPAVEELILEPDALLVLEASELRSCVSWIRPCDASGSDPYGNQAWDDTSMDPAFRRAVAWGWISDDRWALAVTSGLKHDAVHQEPIESVLRWRDGRRADIDFIAKAGSRQTWSVPCENVAASEDLEVHIVRSDSTESGRLSLRLWRIVEHGVNGSSEAHPWGTVVFYGSAHFQQSVLVPAGKDTARFSSVPTGNPLSLSGHDETTSAYGRVVFTHDGTPRTIELRSAFEVAGRVISSDPTTPVASLDWWWKFRDGSRNVLGWHAAGRGLVLPRDGSFRLRGPRASPMSHKVPLDPPAHLVLHIDAPGFDSFERQFETGGSSRVDCGEIVLVPRRSEVQLAPGHGLTLKNLEWHDLKLSAAPETWWTIRHAQPTADAGLEIFLARDEKQPTLYDVHPRAPRAFLESVSERMLIHVLLEHDDEPWAFERRSDGRYFALPRRSFEAEVECRAMPREGKSWRVGWQWHELWDSCEQIPAYELGKTVRIRFSVPTESVTLYWSASGDPPRAGNEPGGSMPIDAVSGKLVFQ